MTTKFGTVLAGAIANVLHIAPTASAVPYADVQFLGLEALYNLTNGEEWSMSMGWLDPTVELCSWYGVKCDGDSGNVTSLSLQGNNLQGLVPEAGGLVDISSLEEVDLSDNQLSGPVPLSLGLLPRLEKLDLSGNDLSYFPSTWGSGATALQHLSIQENTLSGSLPIAWLEVNDSMTYPLVHLQQVSGWLPELRSMLLGGNYLNSTAYTMIQTMATFKSLQTLDLSENALTGSVEAALDIFYCDGSEGFSGCAGNISGVAAPLLRVLKVDGNNLTGRVPQTIGVETARRMDMLDISNNVGLTGTVPDSYSDLLVLFANGTSLSAPDLPSFVQNATTLSSSSLRTSSSLSSREWVRNMFVCPPFEPVAGGDTVAVSLDHAYDGYSLCACDEGYARSDGSCVACPLGSYRDANMEDGTCLICPSNSTTLKSGRWREDQCVCSADHFDEMGGSGSAPSCLPCPFQSTTAGAGAISITACECGLGHILNVTAGVCEACIAGTYKPAYGNDASLCLPCAIGSYSETVGATSSSDCESCPRGTYGSSHGAASPAEACTECPAGTYGIIEGLTSDALCTPCWAGFYSPALGASSPSTCIACPSNHSQPNMGARSSLECIPCANKEVSDEGSSLCTTNVHEDGTLIGLYLLIAGIILVIFVLAWDFLQAYHITEVPMTDKVHMKLNEDMKKFIVGQQFWISLFSGVEIMDLMSDLGAYASLLYTAALTGTMKIIYTIVVAFALTASLHGVHTRAIIILDMQKERTHGLAITGNNMLYYEKQYNILQIMTQKRTCRQHVPFDRGNKYLSHHIGVQRLISLNSMRIIIAIFEDVPFLGLNMFLLQRQQELANNLVFMASFVLSIFVLGYKMTLLEKHARLQIRKWNMEARMDTDTMLNKKAARGRRFSWACQQCEEEGISPIAQKESTQLLFDRTSRRDAGGGKGVGGSGVSNVLLSPIKLAASARRRSRQGTTNANEDKTLSAADTERRETTKVIGCANAGAGNGCGVIGDGDVSDGNTRDAVVGNRSQARLRNDIGNKLFRRGNRTKYQKKKHASSNKRSKHWQFKSTKKVLPSEGYADAGESMADALVHSD